ncbi:hypothetical protein F4860DRAFT_522905 [Xylaria cubensis]|nr:hypothetical protein F4860DRAFT_522905 [Xylaria cubensis]
MVLSASEVAPIEVILLMLGTDGGCVTVKDPDIPADIEGNCDEFGEELVGPADSEELNGGNNPDVDRAEGGTLVPGRPVDGATAEPVKEISGVPELGLGLLIKLVPTPVDEVPSWLLTVTAPVFIDVNVSSEDEPLPVVRVAVVLETGLVAPADDMLPELPDDNGIGPVSIEIEIVDCGRVRLPLEVVITSEAEPVLIVDKGCETVPGLVMLTDGKEVALVRFVGGCSPEVKVWLGMAEAPVLNPELLSKIDPLEAGSKLPCEVRGEPVIDVSSVLSDETTSEVTVELGIVKGTFVEVMRTLPELNTVSDPDGTVPLGPGGTVELARVEGGMAERMVPKLVSDGNTLPFDTKTPVVIVVPMTVVGSTVSVVISAMLDSMAVVIVAPVTVVGVIVKVSIEDEAPVSFALAELAGTDRLLVEVELVTGNGAELDGCTDTVPELPLALALVRLAPEVDSEIGEVPEEIGDASVTIDVIDPPLGTVVGLMRLDELVAVTGGILDRGPVEPVPALVPKPEVRKGGTVFVPDIDLLGRPEGDSVGPLVIVVALGNGKRPVEMLLIEPDAPIDDWVAEIDGILGLVSPPVPVIEPPVGPAVGIEELVMGNGVASLPVKAPVFVSDEMVSDSEVENVSELGPLDEAFVALGDKSDEFVAGKGVIPVVPEDVPARPVVEVIPLPVRPDPDVTRVPVGPAEPLVGLIAVAEEFVNGNGADSLAVTEPGLPVGIDGAVVIDSEPDTVEELTAPVELFVGLAVRAVEFVNGRGIIPVLIEPVMFAKTDVGIDMNPVLEVDEPVAFDSMAVRLTVGIDVFVKGNNVVWLPLKELKGPVGV